MADYTVLTPRFRFVERCIRFLDKLFDLMSVHWEDGDSDTACQEALINPVEFELFDRPQYALAEVDRHRRSIAKFELFLRTSLISNEFTDALLGTAP